MGLAMLLCTNLPVGFVPVKTLPCPQLWIVVVPPVRTTAPPTTPTAVGTLVSLALLITRDPARWPLLGCEFRIKIGVFVTVASIIASAPTVCAAFVSPPVVRSKPTCGISQFLLLQQNKAQALTWQLLMLTPWKVQPGS